MDADLKKLISREIKDAVTRMRKEADAKDWQARQLRQDADDARYRADRMIACDEAGTHEFEDVPGSGRMGSRFEERCKHCGWIHTC